MPTNKNKYSALGLECNPFKEVEATAERLYFSDINMYNVNCDNIIVVGQDYRRIIESIAHSLATYKTEATVISGRFGSGKTSVALGAYCEAVRSIERQCRPLLVYIQAKDLPTDRLQDLGVVDIVALLSLMIAARALCALRQCDERAYNTLVSRLRRAINQFERPVATLINEIIRASECSKSVESNVVVKAYQATGVTSKSRCIDIRKTLNSIVKNSRELLVEINRHALAPIYIVVDQFDNIIKEVEIISQKPGEQQGVRLCLRLRDFLHNFIKATMHEVNTSIYYTLLVLPGMEYMFRGGEGLDASNLMIGIIIKQLNGLKGANEVEELIDKFFTSRFIAQGRVVGPCYSGYEKPSKKLFKREALEELAKLRYPRDILLVLREVIEEAKTIPITADFVERVKVKVQGSFDPDICTPPDASKLLDALYPRILLRNIIQAARSLDDAQASAVKVKIIKEAWSNNWPIGVILKITITKNGKETSERILAVVAGRKRVDKRTFEALLSNRGNRDDNGRTQGLGDLLSRLNRNLSLDALLTISVEGIAGSTYNYLVRNPFYARARKKVDVKLKSYAGMSKESSKLRTLGCLENAEDPESVIRALLYIAGISESQNQGGK